MINRYIIDPIRSIHIKWGGFHGIGKFDIHPFDFVPRLHSGGVFMSGNSRGEGLALLRDGERVLTPEQDRARGGHTTINHWPAGIDPVAMVRAQRTYIRRNGAAA